MAVSTETETWATRGEAALALSAILGESVSVNTMMTWLRQASCPLPRGGGPIPREALIEWCKTERKSGRKRAAPESDYQTLELEKLVEEVRRLRGQNARLYDESINAEDARQGITRAVEELRRELTQEIPSAAWASSQGKPAEEGVAAIRSMLTEALNRFAEGASRIAP